MTCPRCGKSLRNLPEHLPEDVRVACNRCLEIAEKPETARTAAEAEASMTIDQVRRGGARRRG